MSFKIYKPAREFKKGIRVSRNSIYISKSIPVPEAFSILYDKRVGAIKITSGRDYQRNDRAIYHCRLSQVLPEGKYVEKEPGIYVWGSE